ncbi:DUF1206 domain-containing protein [Deinococcus detaillensis]|uniref:DUF1206 domain-containing protein n=1 Tax=Deinococcus detaillensis TaxID=2592048 RepID=A0A553V155_9DEIO|nr:DUF1206 domain-containing protein [Deinococcus detaillensis]TSA86200.1 DUF1206 domain-containing protein [Deinococcus detaillensis]
MSTTRSQVEQAGRQVAPGLEVLARFGYASKGVLYGTVGFLALSLALGDGGTTTDNKGALLRLQDLPAGRVLLWLLVVGLVGYVLWQLLRAVLDPEHQGTEAKGLIKRAGYLISGGLYLTLAVFSARLAAQGSAPYAQNSQAQTAAKVLHLPGGQLLLGLVGVALLAVAADQLYSAYSAKFMERMAFSDVGAQYQGTLERIGQVGVAARGLLLTIMGVFLLVAAWRDQGSIVVGTSGALGWLRHQPAGQFLLGAVALGTLCYGVWCVIQARYRRVKVVG